MTPDLNALQSAALAFVREVKTSSKDKQQDVPLRVSRELAVNIIRTERYSASGRDQPYPRSPYIHQGAIARPRQGDSGRHPVAAGCCAH